MGGFYCSRVIFNRAASIFLKSFSEWKKIEAPLYIRREIVVPSSPCLYLSYVLFILVAQSSNGARWMHVE